jgi:hypothetical protein
MELFLILYNFFGSHWQMWNKTRDCSPMKCIFTYPFFLLLLVFSSPVFSSLYCFSTNGRFDKSILHEADAIWFHMPGVQHDEPPRGFPFSFLFLFLFALFTLLISFLTDHFPPAQIPSSLPLAFYSAESAAGIELLTDVSFMSRFSFGITYQYHSTAPISHPFVILFYFNLFCFFVFFI